MMIHDRKFTFTEEEKKVLLESSDIICKIADEMYEDETIISAYINGYEEGELHDLARGIRELAMDGEVHIERN